MPDTRPIATRLSEGELAALNLKLRKEGFNTLGDLVRNYIDSSFSLTDRNIEKLASGVADLVTKKLLTVSNKKLA